MSIQTALPEPVIPAPRETEVLLLVLDGSKYFLENNEEFSKLRNVAMVMARTRLLYSESDHDCVGVFKVGSSITNNRLARDNPGGYGGIELIVPAIRKSLHAVQTVRNLSADGEKYLLIDALEAFGDYLSDLQSTKAKRKRIVFFTQNGQLVSELSESDREELIATCDLYREHGVQIEVITPNGIEDDDDEDDDEDNENGRNDASRDHVSQSSKYFEQSMQDKPVLYAIARATGGGLYGAEEALYSVEKPQPRRKRPVAKFRGVLDIASVVQIPVKVFSHVMQAKHEASTKVSWEMTKQRKELVRVHVETQRVVSAQDDVPLERHQIVHAYAYGTSLIPEPNEVDTYAWSISFPKGMHTIAFVSQKSIPVHYFMSAVNVVMAMSNIKEARAAMSALVCALHKDKKGILARYVSSPKGGAAILTYLWPCIEYSREDGSVKNTYLYMVELPCREDLREYPFASLNDIMDGLSDRTEEAMDNFIESRMLMGEEDEDESNFDVANICSPFLDRFYLAVIHRALDGLGGTTLPPLSKWQERLLNPKSFLTVPEADDDDDALQNLKRLLPVSKKQSKEKVKKKILQALKGEAASISDFLPPREAETIINDAGDAEGDDLEAMEEVGNWRF